MSHDETNSLYGNPSASGQSLYGAGAQSSDDPINNPQDHQQGSMVTESTSQAASSEIAMVLQSITDPDPVRQSQLRNDKMKEIDDVRARVEFAIKNGESIENIPVPPDLQRVAEQTARDAQERKDFQANASEMLMGAAGAFGLAALFAGDDDDHEQAQVVAPTAEQQPSRFSKFKAGLAASYAAVASRAEEIWESGMNLVRNGVSTDGRTVPDGYLMALSPGQTPQLAQEQARAVNQQREDAGPKLPPLPGAAVRVA